MSVVLHSATTFSCLRTLQKCNLLCFFHFSSFLVYFFFEIFQTAVSNSDMISSVTVTNCRDTTRWRFIGRFRFLYNRRLKAFSRRLRYKHVQGTPLMSQIPQNTRKQKLSSIILLGDKRNTTT